MRDLREEDGNCFSKLGLLKVIYVTRNYDGVCLTFMMLEHYFKITCNVYILHVSPFYPF